MKDLTKAQFALDKAKMSFLSINGSPFLATILFGMKHSFCDSVPTLATTGLKLIINPDHFLSIPEKQREAELAHECWHVALDHISRLYDRDHERWNIATDYAINIMMHDSKKFQVGADWL
jgi:predicted metal-dependent peptidase